MEEQDPEMNEVAVDVLLEMLKVSDLLSWTPREVEAARKHLRETAHWEKIAKQVHARFAQSLEAVQRKDEELIQVKGRLEAMRRTLLSRLTDEEKALLQVLT